MSGSERPANQNNVTSTPGQPFDYQQIFESTPALFLVLAKDAKFTILGASDAYLHATFTEREHIVGRGLFDVFPDNPRDPHATGTKNLRASLERVVASKLADAMAVQKYDIPRPSSAGGGFEERYWSPLNSPVLSDSGEIQSIIHRVEDVTEFVKAKKSLGDDSDATRLDVLLRSRELDEANRQLREANEQFQAIYEQGLFAGRLNLDGTVFDINRAALEVCGFRRADIIGRPFWECGWWNRSTEVQDWVRQAVTQAVSGEPFRGESRYFWNDGSEHIVDFACMPIKDAGGRVIVVVPTGMDITERVEAEENRRALEQERDRAQALADIDRAKTTFFSNVSHEFRTPLTLMIGPLQDALSQPTPLTDKVRDELSVALRNSLRLLKLVNTLLDFARIEAARAQPNFQPVDLSKLTCEVASAFRSAIERAKLRLVLDCRDLDEPVFVDGDMWEKIVLNLISNAFKYTFEGEITVVVRRLGKLAELSVRDTGTGIPSEELPRLFERFHRIQGARARTHEGSGIGLALVQELVKLHGGTIRAESELHRGTTVFVTIPFGKTHLPADRIAAPSPLASTAIGAAPFVEALRWLPDAPPPDPASIPEMDALWPMPPETAGPKARIVIADDNQDMRAYLRRLLSPRYDVEAVSDGQAALEAAKSRRPDLILTDVMMPRLDGFGLLRKVRQDPALNDIPVIMISARAGEEARVEGVEAKADDYIVKPFSARELVARVDTHLETNRVRRKAAAELEEANARLLCEIEARKASSVVEARLGAIVGSSDDAIISKTLDGIITSWNAGAQALFGYTAEEAIGQSILLIVPPERYDEEADILRKLGKGERINHFETQRLAKNGERIEISLSVSPVRDSTGTIVGASKIARDITEKKRIEREREQLLDAERNARAEAQRVNQLKDEFFATLSHELRTPLNAIMGWAQLMGLGSMRDDEMKEAGRAIERNARTQKQLIDDLLDMSRIISGKLRLDVQQIEPVSVIETAIETIRPTAAFKDIRIEKILDPLAGPISGDPARLQQVVWNLLCNAVKFTSKGGRIQVRLERVNSHIEVSVSDTGQGIDPNFLPHLFERFRQADASTTRMHGGLGIGLAIVKEIVELHGGTVRAKSDGEGKGATFVVTLPLLILKNAANRFHPRAWSDAPAEMRLTDLSGLKILFVDDEPDARGLVKRLLEECGAKVTVAESAVQALDAATTCEPDVIISDIGMPDVDGYEFLRKLRMKNDRSAKTPAIALTAFARSEDRTRALRAGYINHVAKPIEPSELVATIAVVTGRVGEELP